MQHCNYCRKETKTVEGDCVECNLSKVTPPDLMVEASNLIDTILERNHITQFRLAKVMGVTTVHICNVYNGKKEPSEMMVKFLKVINTFPATIKVLE